MLGGSRIRVEGKLRKTEEGKARLRAAASRVGDQDDNNAGMPEPT